MPSETYHQQKILIYNWTCIFVVPAVCVVNVKHLVSYQFLPHPTWTCTQDNSLTVMLNHHCQQEPLRFTYKQHSSSTHINQQVNLWNIFCQTAMNTISDQKEYRLRLNGIPFQTGRNIPSQTRRNTISDQKEHHLRPEGIPSQTRRTTISDQKEYLPRPEGTPSQTRRNTFPDQNEYHLRPEGPPSQTRRNTISDQKDHHLRPEGIPSETRRNTISYHKEHHHRDRCPIPLCPPTLGHVEHPLVEIGADGRPPDAALPHQLRLRLAPLLQQEALLVLLVLKQRLRCTDPHHGRHQNKAADAPCTSWNRGCTAPIPITDGTRTRQPTPRVRPGTEAALHRPPSRTAPEQGSRRPVYVLEQRLRCTDPHHGRHQNKAVHAPCTSWNRGCAALIPITDGTRTRQPTPRVRPGTEAALHRSPSRTAPEQGSRRPVYVLKQRLRCTDPHHGRHQNKAADAPCTSWNRGCAAPIPITDGTRTRQPTPRVRPGTEAALHRSPSRTAPEHGSRRPVYVLGPVSETSPSRTAPEQGSRRPVYVLEQRLRCTDPHHGRHQNKAADAPCTSWNRGCAALIPITDGTRTRQPTPRVRPGASLRDVPITDGTRTRQPTPRVRPGTEAALHRPPSRTAPEQGSRRPGYVLEQRLRCTDPHHGRHQNKAADAPCTSWNRGCAAPIPITDGTRTRQPTPRVRPGTEAALHWSPSRTAPEQGSSRSVYVLEQRLRCTDPYHGRHQNKAADAPCTSWNRGCAAPIPITDGTRTRQPTPRVRPGTEAALHRPPSRTAPEQGSRRPVYVLEQRLRCTHHGRHQNKAADAPCTSWNRGCAAPIPITDGTRTRQPTPRVRPGTEAALHRSPSRTAPEQGSRRPVYVLEQRLRCTDPHHGRHQNKAADAPCTSWGQSPRRPYHGRHQNKAADAPCTSWNRGCAALIPITDGTRTRQPTPSVRPGTEAALHWSPSRTAPEQGSRRPVYVLEQRLRCTDPHHGRHQNKAADAPCTSWNRGCAALIPITDGTRTRQPTPSVRPGTEAALHWSPSRTAPEQGSRRPVYVLEQRLRCTDPHHGRHQNKAADAPCTSWNRGCAAPIPITDGTRTRQPTPRVRPGASLRDVPITDGTRTRQPTPRVRPGASLRDVPITDGTRTRQPTPRVRPGASLRDVPITDGTRTRQPTPSVRPGASLRDVPITDGTRTRQPTPRVRPGASLRDVDSLSHS